MKNSFLDCFKDSVLGNRLKDILKKEKAKVQLTGLVGSAFSILARSIIKNDSLSHLFILNNKEDASYFLNDMQVLLRESILFFPESYQKFYEFEEKQNPNILLRAETLHNLRKRKKSIIITYPEAIFEKVLQKKELKQKTIILKNGENKEIEDLESALINFDFNLVDFVFEPGQFSKRGGIVDIFSYSQDSPYRIEFSDNVIQSIRIFNPNDQLSVEIKNQADIVGNVGFKKSQNKQVSISEYLNKNSVIWVNDIKYVKGVLTENLKKSEKYFDSLDTKIKCLNAKELFMSGEVFCDELKKFRVIENFPNPFLKESILLKFQCNPLLSFNKKFNLLIRDLIKNQKKGFQNIILCSSSEQEDHFHEIFRNTKEEIKYRCVQLTLREGFIENESKLALYTDHEIFDRYYRFRPKIKFDNKKAITLKELTSLKIGDFVTHIDHGIGKFSGLHKITINNVKQEAIKLLYKNDDILYINIHSLHKIARFSAKEGVLPKINQLGSSLWSQQKQKTKKRVKEIAFNLIKLYAKRKMQSGFSFSSDSYLQHELESSFMYEDTPDQITATNSVKRDMEQKNPMDRLICGDVGFGKTEVAIRAAFKAVTDNKQVAILVPTTILALQHYKTFKKRLASFPCNIEYINRFHSKKSQKNIMERLKAGMIDILIGTHRIISKDVEFKDLGLLIIDEEQKFGVNAKEKFKNIKSSLDTLVLSATPIPRTLQFSLMGARDLSIINTPPPNRQAIRTEVIGLSEKIIGDAISYEISRNGQVFFIHNRIKNIKEVAEFIQRLCPYAKIKTGHGKMKGDSLEKLMIDFIEGRFDVLISTTIIENGLDISNANTIIINNAQNFGLSDLHQMRGRVGRSNKKAFCYLISPPKHQISDVARKRLNALEEFSNLGSGFNIAMRDLDIRGAGDLLGADQSGFINQLGFETYQKILNEAIEELKREKFQELFKNEKKDFYINDCQIETDLEILIPDDYVSSTTERFSLYKLLNSFKEESEIKKLKEELLDRFGKIPTPTIKLFDVLRLKWLAKDIGFERIVLKKGSMSAYFISIPNSRYFDSKIFSCILNYIKCNPKNYELKETNNKRFLYLREIPSLKEAIRFCNNIILD